MAFPACSQSAPLVVVAYIFGFAPGTAGWQTQTSADDPATLQADASRWLAALRQKGPLSRERILVVAASGEIVDTIEGEKSRVDFPTRLRPYLADVRNPVTLVHNHPAGTGLNANDLDLLARPGVRRIIAVTHDGSLYEASAGPLADPAVVKPCLYHRARLALERALERDRRLFDRYAADENYAHLMTLVLGGAGAIRYRATVGGYRRLSWNSNRIVFERAVASAADQVKNSLHRCRPT